MNRRRFLKNNIVAGTGVALAPSFALGKGFAPDKQARIGFIGVGLRGTNHLKNLLRRKDVLIPAICDIDPERIKIALDLIAKAGF
ncbi:MAG: gfo/Idh/MocA family oxidoreductase, partial [Segetibacter sp.]